jgi:two-component system cell cycle sensor histidine kinase/response regulator CckA
MSVGTKKALNQRPGGRSDAQSLSLLGDKVLAMIIGQTPLVRTLAALCAEIEKHEEGMICSVLLLDSDGVTLRSTAGPSLPAEYSHAIDGVKAGECAGSCGTAIFRKEPVVVSDIANDRLWADWRHLALPHGLRACWSTPIASQDGTLLGTFAIYYREPRRPDSRHLQLIVHATHLAALAIERDRDKTQLRAAEDKFRTLVERLPAITYIAELGTDGPWHYVSPQIQTMLGFSPEDWLADPCNWIHQIHPEDREIAFAAEKEFQEKRELFKAEYRMFARDGKVLWFRDEGVMLPVADGRALMQGVLYDITEHKRLEEQLRHSQKMEAVGQLAGGVAHDFNNLLMLIQAHNERLRGRLTSNCAEHEDTLEIEQAVNQAAALTQQLLAFSRRQLLQLQVLDLNVVVTNTARMVERLIVPNIDLRVIADSSAQFIKADPSQLGQVILNLAVNARDAMPSGGRLTIRTQSVELQEARVASHGVIPPGKYTLLAVSDTGTGMGSEVQSHIFEPFYTTKKPGKGTGLGLAIVYGVVKQTGGWIAVRSKPGEGTSFEIYFPRADAGKVDAIAKTKGLPASAACGSETVLLVEDQTGIRELVHEFLKRNGYSVLCAADGSEALRIADDYGKQIDLLVTDVVMPNMGGRELAHRLTHTRPQTKVLFMSGNPDQSFQNGRPGEPPALVLQKPFPLEVLLNKVRSVLDQ